MKKIPPKEEVLIEFSKEHRGDECLPERLVPLLTLIYATSAFGDERRGSDTRLLT